MWSASVVLAPLDVGLHTLAPAVEVLALLLVGVERPEVLVAGAVAGSAGGPLPEWSWSCQRPLSCTVSSSAQVRYSGSPSSTRPTSANMTALKPNSSRIPSPPGPGVGARVVEREQQRPRREVHLLALHEVDERLAGRSSRNRRARSSSSAWRSPRCRRRTRRRPHWRSRFPARSRGRGGPESPPVGRERRPRRLLGLGERHLGGGTGAAALRYPRAPRTRQSRRQGDESGPPKPS